MENNQQILNKIKLMMSYELGKTLNENVESIPLLNETKVEVDEDAFLKGAVDAIKDAKGLRMANPKLFTALSDVLKVTSEEGKQIKGIVNPGTVQHVAIKDVNGLINSIKAGMKPQEVAQLYKGLLKSKNTPSNILQSITRDVVESKKFIGSYGKMTDKQLRAELANRGYSDLAIDAISTETKNNKIFKNARKGNVKVEKPTTSTTAAGETQTGVKNSQEAANELNAAQKSTEVVPEAKEIAKEGEKLAKENPKKWSLFNDIKEKLKKKYWYYLGGLSVIGLGAAALNALGFFRPDDDLFNNNCIDELIDDGSATVTYTSGGDPVVYVKNTGNEEYDKMGGLNFFNTGRVFSRDNTKRGYWKCSDDGSGSNTMEVIREQLKTDPQLNSDVDIMIDLLDFPVSQNDLKNAYNLLKKYANNGKGKEFLEKYSDSGAGYGSMKMSLDFIYTKDSTSVDYKNAMYKVIKQMESGGEETADLGGIQIKWDGDKSGDNTGGDGTTIIPKPNNQNKYVDCSNVDIATTPLQYGCKDKRIAEIQGCIGVATDGKFGPKTLKALVDGGYEASNGITKEMYDKVIANCKKGDTTGQMSDEDKARVNYLKTPIKLDLGPVPQMPNKNNINQPTDTVTKTLSPTNESPQDFYVRLESNGNFNSGKFGRDRARYKGKELNDEDLGKLDEFFRDSGYERRRPRITGKNYGEKYVWIKQ